MVDAILAYDCAANPNRKVKGAAKDFWNCMQNAQTCGRRESLRLSGRPAASRATTVRSSAARSGTGVDPNTRIDCTQKGPGGGENCAPSGRRAARSNPDASNNSALCVGPQRRACSGSVGCVDGGLSICDDAASTSATRAPTSARARATRAARRLRARPRARPALARATNDVTCTSGNVPAKGCVTLSPESVDCTRDQRSWHVRARSKRAHGNRAFRCMSRGGRRLHRRRVRRRRRSAHRVRARALRGDRLYGAGAEVGAAHYDDRGRSRRVIPERAVAISCQLSAREGGFELGLGEGVGGVGAVHVVGGRVLDRVSRRAS